MKAQFSTETALIMRANMATHYSEEFYQRKTKIPENSMYNAH